MVELKVDNGKIKTKISSNPNIPLYEEIGQGVVQLLRELQIEAVKSGNSPQHVKAAYDEMITVIEKNADVFGTQVTFETPGLTQ